LRKSGRGSQDSHRTLPEHRISAHIDAGKTTTPSASSSTLASNHRSARLHDGAATMDWMEQEQERASPSRRRRPPASGKGMDLSYPRAPHQHHRHAGPVDFTIEVERSLRRARRACMVYDAVAECSPVRDVWRQANKYRVPRLAFINKMDRVGANTSQVLRALRNRLKGNAGARSRFTRRRGHVRGRIDLVTMEAIYWDDAPRE